SSDCTCDIAYFPTRRSSDLTFEHEKREFERETQRFEHEIREFECEKQPRLCNESRASVMRVTRARNPSANLGQGKIARLDLASRSEEHTSELQSLTNIVCRL